ncbi:hypothetical protein CTheo_6775 [Ceratobasidium theobromae]|uniref:Effector protein n=1 Tax=Ceratobasidium theobromae TaxID=1582974 RepID=A0A5N5QEA2_9AGAM|nr:hypothetical protein CTheo_6775 [Ceratobasidium theobromae]
MLRRTILCSRQSNLSLPLLLLAPAPSAPLDPAPIPNFDFGLKLDRFSDNINAYDLYLGFGPTPDPNSNPALAPA